SVRIEGRTRDGRLELSVIDDGPGLREGMPAGERRGVGLRNTRERLAVLYGQNCRFAVLNAQPGLRVEMALPLEIGALNAETQPARAPMSASGGVGA
ncbi:MAG: sensor histidine kinase, partial [Steroidobacteraceae bacterium]